MGPVSVPDNTLLAMEPDKEDLLLLVLTQGGRRNAVKLYQEETGADLPAARLAVAELATRHITAGAAATPP